MAKNKRKPSAAQRDKFAIETAKILKKKGILSKQTKLHGGKYISRGVLKKVQELQHAAKPSYTALKVDKAFAKRAREEGYQVVSGNRIIVPKEHDFTKRIKAGNLGGLKPVRGGFMSEVQVPFTGENAADLLRWLEGGNLDEFKLPHESFAFRIGDTEGTVGMSYRTFPSSKSMREYLQHYNPKFYSAGFKVYRLHPEDMRTFIRSNRERKRENPGAYGKRNHRGDNMGRTSYAERMERLARRDPRKFNQLKAEQKAKDKARYEKQKADPVYREAARKRAKDSWNRRNKK